MPDGLEDVSKYPDLVAELLRRKWSDDEIRDALGRNLLRVFREVEEVRAIQTQSSISFRISIISNLLSCLFTEPFSKNSKKYLLCFNR